MLANLRTWQLFAILVGPYMVGEFLWHFAPGLLPPLLQAAILSTVWLTILGWLVTIKLQLETSTEAGTNWLYIVLVGCSAVFAPIITFLSLFGNDELLENNAVIDGLWFITLAGILHAMWVAARTLVAAEARYNSGVGSTFWSFLQLYFFPIGIWFIHPRFQRAYQFAT